MGLAFLITTEKLQLLSERKVLKEAEYAALLDAKALVEAARQEGERIVRQATRQAEERRQRGYRDGFEAARAEHAQRVVSDALAAERQLRALRQAMAQIVVKGVSQFVAELDPAELIERALERVDTLIRHEPFLSIRVAPAQEPLLRQTVARLQGEGGLPANVAVQADATLAPGACVVQSASGTLEIGVDAQIEAFRKAIERSGVAMAGGAGAR
ncbi:MAG: type III secretion system stator protein SctL [Rhizobacter sp.]|nr:type III secretion system stator protein SctL [Rhizobacter sp.]